MLNSKLTVWINDISHHHINFKAGAAPRGAGGVTTPLKVSKKGKF